MDNKFRVKFAPPLIEEVASMEETGCDYYESRIDALSFILKDIDAIREKIVSELHKEKSTHGLWMAIVDDNSGRSRFIFEKATKCNSNLALVESESILGNKLYIRFKDVFTHNLVVEVKNERQTVFFCVSRDQLHTAVQDHFKKIIIESKRKTQLLEDSLKKMSEQ